VEVLGASPAVGENSNTKTGYWGKYRTCFGILKVFSLAKRENQSLMRKIMYWERRGLFI
jgi:hypothetical protein